MENELIIYVARIVCKFDSGIGEYTEDEILYVGVDYNLAKQELNNYDVSNSIFRYGCIQHWINGKNENSDVVII